MGRKSNLSPTPLSLNSLTHQHTLTLPLPLSGWQPEGASGGWVVSGSGGQSQAHNARPFLFLSLAPASSLSLFLIPLFFSPSLSSVTGGGRWRTVVDGGESDSNQRRRPREVRGHTCLEEEEEHAIGLLKWVSNLT